MEKFSTQEQQEGQLEIVIDSLVGVLDDNRDLFVKHPQIQEQWYEVEMEALTGKDRLAAKAKLVAFTNTLSRLKQSSI